MPLKRRGFLAMLGAAVTAPALPTAAPARNLYAVAVAHAQKYPVISVGGLARRGAMSVPQAETMLRKLATEGMVKLVGPSPSGGARAASKIMIGDPWGIARTAQERQAAVLREQPTEGRAHNQVKTRPATWLTHLHDICRAEGLTLSPRALGQVA